jgi:hypothetical protein
MDRQTLRHCNSFAPISRLVTPNLKTESVALYFIAQWKSTIDRYAFFHYLRRKIQDLDIFASP